MASENETVAEIRDDVYEYLTSIGPGEYPNETQFEEFADRFVAAHKREIDAVLKDRDEMYKSEQETVAKTKAWFDDYQRTRREVAKLRECIKSAIELTCDNCNLQGDDGKCTAGVCLWVKGWRNAIDDAKRTKDESMREGK